MIAIDTIRLTEATIAARLTATCPGAPRICNSASRGGAPRGRGKIASSITATRGISISVPIRSSAMAMYPNKGKPAIGGRSATSAPAPRVTNPGHDGRSRAKARSSSPALSAGAGGERAASSAGTKLASIAVSTPRPKKSMSASGAGESVGATPRKYPAPKLAPMIRTAACARTNPSASPSALPTTPTIAPSTTKSVASSLRVTPRTRRSASCERRRTIASACVEKTSSPPVNSATSARTFKLTR